jgi:DNA-binding CsgD family transcriptional regulator
VPRDLVESAIGINDHASAMGHTRQVEALGLRQISPRHELVALTCAALTGDHRRAARMFEQALAVAGAQRWPFEYARTALAYGRHLKRHASLDAARPQLRAALDRFRELGAVPWAEQAERALAGNGSGDRSIASRAPLTPREREIAELAATGLSNKEIAARLHVSPRTVSSHLYQAFPKLGITARAALRDALHDAM